MNLQRKTLPMEERNWLVKWTNKIRIIRADRILTLAAILLIGFQVLLVGQDTVDDGSIVDTIDTQLDLFEVEEPMIITLTFDLKKYQKTKSEGEYMPADLSYHINDSVRIEKSIRLKARGAFRRKFCSFAPFWLNIRKSDIKNQHLQDIKRLKVVTQCQNSSTYGEYVLKEYLVYKIYNILSSNSFRTRLVRMKYIDTGRKNKVTESWAFLIEPEEMMAERVNGVVIENDKLSMRTMEPEAFDLVALFQYMVGNSDYIIPGRHNVKIIGLPGFGTKGYTPVPYDFDYSGFVNAEYAIPGGNLGINSVRDRYYLGLCREANEYRQAIDLIESHKEEILDLINSFPHLEKRRKKGIISYLNEYFELSAEPRLEVDLNRTCR
jgi:hypothetical protein